MEAPEPRAFLALGHEEDPDWALGLERARGPARELRQAGAKRACWEFLPGVAGARVIADGPAARGRQKNSS